MEVRFFLLFCSHYKGSKQNLSRVNFLSKIMIDGKPGMCPMESKAKKLMRIFKGARKSTRKPGFNDKNIQIHRFSTGSDPLTSNIRCVGDYTCPGTMKCCANNISVYGGQLPQTRRLLPRRNAPVYGYCMEPVSEDQAIDDNSVDDSTQNST